MQQQQQARMFSSLPTTAAATTTTHPREIPSLKTTKTALSLDSSLAAVNNNNDDEYSGLKQVPKYRVSVPPPQDYFLERSRKPRQLFVGLHGSGVVGRP
ncbi:hypothetical protein HK100_007332, partial [Physocladia obscura]